MFLADLEFKDGWNSDLFCQELVKIFNEQPVINENFVILRSIPIITHVFDECLTVYLDLTIVIYPVCIWNKTIGYELDLLHGYCKGAGLNMSGFNEWVKGKWNIDGGTVDEIYEIVRKRLFKQVLYGN